MKSLKILTLLIISALSLTSCSGDSNSSPASGSIHGIVTNTGDPLKGIGVSLYENIGYSTSLLRKTVTYDDGTYEFTDLDAGVYLLKVEDGRFETFSTSVTVQAGRTARADMKLTPIYIDIRIDAYTLDATVNEGIATLRGKYTCSSGYSPQEIGFYYSTSPNPATNGTKVTASDDTNFSVNIGDLSIGDYYYQAYAKNSLGTAYGEILKFSVTSTRPVVVTKGAVTGANYAMLTGEITYVGNPPFTERGFIYSDVYPTPTINNGTVISIDGDKQGEYQFKLNGLEENATYYFRAYAKNADGISYGDVVSFVCGYTYTIPYANLMVQKNDLGAAPHSEAIEMCSDSRVGGFSDWRLPTLSELQIICEHADEIGGFNYGAKYWSSSTRSSGQHYFITCGNNKADYGSTNTARIRAVRSIN